MNGLDPKEILAGLIEHRVTSTQIANECAVTKGHVCNVIHGRSRSPLVETAIARHLGKRSDEVFRLAAPMVVRSTRPPNLMAASVHKGDETMSRMPYNEIRAELVRRGIKIVDISQECQVSGALVYLVMKGQRHNLLVKKVVARHLGMSSREVFGDDSPSEAAS